MLRQLLTSCCVALLLATTLGSAHAIEVSSKPLAGSQVGIAYQLSPNGRVYGKNQDLYFHPASTQKIVTALAALLYLGPDYQIATKLQVNAKALTSQRQLKVDGAGTLHSDVIIAFSGDPTLRVDHYRSLLNVLTTYGVKRIDGNILLDVSRFGGPGRATGWSWDDLPACFTAPSAPIILNRNCTFAQLQGQGVGTEAHALIPQNVPIDIRTDVMVVASEDYGGDCILEGNLYIDNKYHLSGCIPTTKDNKPWPLSLAIADAERWGVDWTKQLLTELNIRVSGSIAVSRTPLSNTVTIALRKSPQMSELVEYMLTKSNNLYADAIAKNIAAEYFDLPATYYRSSRALRSILKQYADIDLDNAYMVDGSGLSPHNLLTPRKLLEILDYINQHNATLGLVELFPVSGKNGTMKYRPSTKEEPLKDHVIAKTGSLQNVSNLAGFVLTQSGERVPFVIFSNSITYSENMRDRIKYRGAASPHFGYERYVLENIYYERVMGRDF